MASNDKALLAIAKALPLKKLAPGQAMAVTFGVLLLIFGVAIVAGGAANLIGAVIMFLAFGTFSLFAIYYLARIHDKERR